MGKQEGDLGKLELELMQVVWQKGEGTVGTIQNLLTRPLAYTTVQTVLNILHRKGKLGRRLEGRAYVYTAEVTAAQTATQALRDLLDRMFGGSAEALMLNLVETQGIDPERIARLQELLLERSKKRQNGGKHDDDAA